MLSTIIEAFSDPRVLTPFLIGVGTILGIALFALAIRLSYRKSIRTSLQMMLQSKEAIRALLGGITEMQKRLSAPNADDKREAFVHDKFSTDRIGFADLKSRAKIIVDELDLISIPKKLTPLAEALADIAFVIEQEVTKVDAIKDEKAIDALGEIDIETLNKALSKAEEHLEKTAVAYGITEVAVYKGGLYV